MKYPEYPNQPAISNLDMCVLGDKGNGWKTMQEFLGMSFPPVFEIKYDNEYDQRQLELRKNIIVADQK